MVSCHGMSLGDKLGGGWNVVMLYKVRSAIDYVFFFFFNDTATTEIYTLSLHDALPISIVHVYSKTGKFCIFMSGKFCKNIFRVSCN